MTECHTALIAALFELEAELRRLELWEAEAPGADCFASTVPFCHDTMFFHQWLQWVLLPRLGELLELGTLPPFPSQMAELAELTWESTDLDAAGLIALLRRIDRLLGEPAPRRH